MKEKDKIQYAFEKLNLETIDFEDIDKLADHANKKLTKIRMIEERTSNHEFIKSDKPFIKVCKKCGKLGYEYHPDGKMYHKSIISNSFAPALLGHLYVKDFNIHCKTNILELSHFKKTKIKLIVDLPHVDSNFKKGKIFWTVPCPVSQLQYIRDCWIYGKERKEPCRLLSGEYKEV